MRAGGAEKGTMNTPTSGSFRRWIWTGIALCLVGFAEEATDRRFPLPRRAFAGACGVLAVVALHTDAIVAPTVHPLVLSLHAGPVLVPVMAPLTDLFFVLLLLVSHVEERGRREGGEI